MRRRGAFDRDRERLRRMVALRLDRRLQGRVDPSDVIQEAYIDAAARLAGIRSGTRRCRSSSGCGSSSASGWPSSTAIIWASQARDAGREISALPRRHAGGHHGGPGRAAARASTPRPSEAAVRAERKIRLQEALNAMDPIDREILALRHFEQMTNGETATVLGLDKSAASKRYVRALARLKESWRPMPAASREL